MRFSRGFRGFWALLLVVAADRFSKAWAARSLAGRGSVPALPGLLNWHYARNTGAAFSALSGRTGLLTLLTALLLAGVCAWIILKRPGGLMRTGLWLVLAGGLSNLFDRAVYGYVVDFIEFAFVRFAIFNVADVSICLGAGLVALAWWRTERREAKEHG